MKAHRLAGLPAIDASKRYHKGYDNVLFVRATRKNRNVARANHLIDTALALCGSPYYRVDHTEWNQDEIAFLQAFVIDKVGLS